MLQVLATEYVYCDGLGAGIDKALPALISTLITILKIGIPILLIVFGMLDMGKAVISNDEKEMKSAQGTLIKRLIYAVVVFFIVAIVQFVVGLIGGTGTDTGNASANKNAKTCIDCFINGHCNGDANLTTEKNV